MEMEKCCPPPPPCSPCSPFCYMTHLFPQVVTVMKPSSHCVHPKFPFQEVSYSKPYLVKNNLKKLDEREEESADPGGERAE